MTSDMHSQVSVARLGTFRLRALEELITFLNPVCQAAPISYWPADHGHFAPLYPFPQPTTPNTEQPSVQMLNVISLKQWVISTERCDCS